MMSVRFSHVSFRLLVSCVHARDLSNSFSLSLVLSPALCRHQSVFSSLASALHMSSPAHTLISKSPISFQISKHRILCVCVCPTLDKGSSTTISPQAGDGDTCIASPSTKLAIHGEDISSGRGTDVPAFNTMTPLVHPAAVRCFHGPSCYHPQTHCSLTADLQPR